ncbi:MAG: substrate-binding periplasmic protein [Pseudodesulfovibrio sp.]|uniref:substrate-binding periplasmic protein n=1 Tax=Pseudodesulfovibrio sp. TaxID=2035812 RepID=UPI003D0D774A
MTTAYFERLRARVAILLQAAALGVALSAALSPAPCAAQERLLVVADRRMPYNGEPGDPREGYAVEILRAVFERKGYEVEYALLPWKRAVQDVRTGSADILIGAVREEMPDLIYPTQSLGRADLCFYSTDKDWRFTGPDSLSGVVTGFVPGHSYPDWFLQALKDQPNRFHALHGGDAFSRMLAMLVEGRVQVIPGSRAVADYYIRTGQFQEQVFFGGCSDGDTHDLFFALSPANMPRASLLADALDSGVDTLRNTGQLNHLLIKYGLKDWLGLGQAAGPGN